MSNLHTHPHLRRSTVLLLSIPSIRDEFTAVHTPTLCRPCLSCLNILVWLGKWECPRPTERELAFLSNPRPVQMGYPSDLGRAEVEEEIDLDAMEAVESLLFRIASAAIVTAAASDGNGYDGGDRPATTSGFISFVSTLVLVVWDRMYGEVASAAAGTAYSHAEAAGIFTAEMRYEEGCASGEGGYEEQQRGWGQQQVNMDLAQVGRNVEEYMARLVVSHSQQQEPAYSYFYFDQARGLTVQGLSMPTPDLQQGVLSHHPLSPRSLHSNESQSPRSPFQHQHAQGYGFAQQQQYTAHQQQYQQHQHQVEQPIRGSGFTHVDDVPLAAGARRYADGEVDQVRVLSPHVVTVVRMKV
ncbi:hypothetical protein BDQ12DRAFT_725500 [Crucibulum laeve]|uniref:Uncharacterized protein n=1 Tax=Crucibulum laeve TaxID=68775 RepID=A0A5C3LT48_9AGAR|nr:hypothetical protein BDQ12DRAFT_725500 [Crucibulum laeve]